MDPDAVLRSSLSERAKHGRSGLGRVLDLVMVDGGCDNHLQAKRLQKQ